MQLRFCQDKSTQISRAIPMRIAAKKSFFSFSADIT